MDIAYIRNAKAAEFGHILVMKAEMVVIKFMSHGSVSR